MTKKSKLKTSLSPQVSKLDKLMRNKDKKLPRYKFTNINKETGHCTVTCLLGDFDIEETVNADDNLQGQEIVASKILYILKEKGLDHVETKRRFN